MLILNFAAGMEHQSTCSIQAPKIMHFQVEMTVHCPGASLHLTSLYLNIRPLAHRSTQSLSSNC